MTSKNQTTLPKAVVALLGARPSAVLAYEVRDDRSVRLTAKSATFADHLATFARKRPKVRVSVETMNQAIEQTAARRFRKHRS